MDIKLYEISVRDVFDGYENNEETGQVVAYGGKLNVRPAYQREFVYDDKKKVAVMHSILHQFPLNVMYWSENADGTYEMLDGQQRTISICDWLDNGYSIFANPASGDMTSQSVKLSSSSLPPAQVKGPIIFERSPI